MRVEAAELMQVALPLVRPFRTSLGTQYTRTALLLRLRTDVGDGWAECVAEDEPSYSPEYIGGSVLALETFLLPALFALENVTPYRVQPALAAVRAHPMAKSAVEMAVLDAWLRAAGMPLADYLGGTRDHVGVGVSIGITDTVDALLAIVQASLDRGYQRIKLKIESGWDLEPVRAVRAAFGDDVMLTVDANTAYALGDLPHLRRLEPFGLAMIEQPFAPDDLHAHAVFAARTDIPVCLDESIVSARGAADAIRLGACAIINIKPGRVGGYLEAVRIHDLARANGVPVWCGGMLETGIGRAGNLALASLPGFTLPSDISATARYFRRDLTRPFVIEEGGRMAVPREPGLGVEVDVAMIDETATDRRLVVPAER